MLTKNYRFSPSPEKLAEEVRSLSAAGMSDADLKKLCTAVVRKAPAPGFMDAEDQLKLADQVFAGMRRELEILQVYADDPDITEIMVNGPDSIFAERRGKTEQLPLKFESSTQLLNMIRRIAAKVGRELNDLNPILDARLSDGSRVNAVHSNIAINGPILTIRRFSGPRLSMEGLTESGHISSDAAAFLITLVRCGYNIFISGGTGSGKTTFLNVLSDYIPEDERIIVIEDSAELKIRGHSNLVRLEAKNANGQGKGEVSIRDLVKTSLRMRPDRIIVGEVRSAETVDMLQAMNTGHDGSLSTGHANSPESMLSRLESMAIAGSDYPAEVVRKQISQAIDIIVHLARHSDGSRRVMEISELGDVQGDYIELNPIFKYRKDRGLLYTGNELNRTEKLELHGESIDYGAFKRD